MTWDINDRAGDPDPFRKIVSYGFCMGSLVSTRHILTSHSCLNYTKSTKVEHKDDPVVGNYRTNYIEAGIGLGDINRATVLKHVII